MDKEKKLIAFMGGMIDQEKNSNFIRELEKEGRKQGFFILAFSFSETTVWDQDRDNCELKLIELCGHLDIKAIIVQLEFIKNDYLVVAINELGRRKGIPVIAMEKYLPKRINVSMCYKESFKAIVRHVIDVHSCRRINMIAGPKGDHFSEERICAYKEVLAENDIPFEENRLLYGEFWDRPARAATKSFIQSGDEFDAIVCANDNMAIACVDELISHGIKVPEDVIVTGFDGIKSGLYNVPSITTVAPDYADEAEMVIRLIKECTDLKEESYHDVDFVLKLRESCGCRRSGDILAPKDIMVLSAGYYDVNWAVNSINSLMSQAAVLESVCELSRIITQTLWIWDRQFQFVGVFSDLLAPEIEGIDKHRYTTLFRCEDGERTGIGSSYDEPEFIPGFNDIVNNSNYSLLLIRLLHTGNQVFGYLVCGSEATKNRDVRRCEEFGMFLSSAINAVVTNRKLADIRNEIAQNSIIDYLTGIYNRRGFLAEVKKIIENTDNYGKYLTIFSIDMDKLKYINDMFGHAQGDFAIQNMAEAVKHLASRNGICARYGGDEFACALLTDMEIYLSADTVRSRIENVLQQKEAVRKKEYEITASIGSATGVINESLDFQSLFDRADEAMYADKKARKAARQ
ncbi:substrate-binding and GGDEF domain-containing protein [Butyrivibrio sp. YAB3001]|uniref:substrate-binding and GGDEF domain-containing protein n=1 Tax=Butyrivibrio sp. YAB3001 TaxID=1520812 RepID=UPI0008F689A2|nr:GGDEF domain-containing protein [Butyrivibrio sp. YAB3001]SFD03603.1 diguanylate cyclase (GGDEF) domain-containing protein [Butyrivibrio sp. YAB3001]